MMLRVENAYLDFNQVVEQDRQAKLFESIEEISGDVSFEFEIELTQVNALALGFPYPDVDSKRVYQNIDADLMNEEGQLVSRGFIKIERKIGKNLMCSFFGGNSNWFAMLTGNMTDLRLSQYDVEQTTANIISSWTQTEGIVWPLIDTGALSTRSFRNAKIEDFTPGFYVKTLFFQIFQQAGLKITGELLKDWRYNNLIVCSNGRSQEQIDSRSSYALKNTPQTISFPTPEVITFDDDSTFPYFDGSQNNFNLALSRYVADIKMRVTVLGSCTITSSLGGGLSIRKNGTAIIGGFIQSTEHTVSGSVDLDAGDYIELSFLPFTAVTTDVIAATFKITPSYIYKAYGVSSVPKWTKQDFVSQVLALFNVVPAYDTYTKTVTFNLFDKIKSKEPIDVSEFIEVIEEDYSEFISDYGKNNNFKYQETDIDNLQKYNISTFLKYGTGVIEVENDFIEESVDVLESDFAAPISYINGAFDMSLERIQFVEIDEDESTTITSVTDLGGTANFHISEDIFAVNDLVRITDSSNISYNGEYVVASLGAGTIVIRGIDFDTDATGTITKLVHQFTNDDSVYLFLNIPNYNFTKVSSTSFFYFEDVSYGAVSIAYFNLLNTGRQINTDYKQGLSFGSIVNPLFYQRTMLQDYWASFGRILNDPVRIRANANLPWKVHNEIDFLRPIMIKTLETVNLYYCNRERGYNNSYTPCELELIKLS